MIDRFSWALLLPAICIALLLHLMPGSTYATAEAMNTYFGVENSPGSWTWEHLDLGSWAKDWEPFKYRIVFRGMIDALAGVFLMFGATQDIHTYWLAFLTVSVAVHVFAIWACDRFLEATRLSIWGRLCGIVAWLLLPPILFAYMLPVQTKEDFLAYGLIFLALRAMLKGDWLSVVVICGVGAFVRETLLIIAGLFFIGTNAPRRMKLAALLIPIGIHIGLRITLGMNGYLVFRETNLLSVVLPIFTLAIIFGYGWVPLIRYIARADVIAPVRRGFATLFSAQLPPLATLQDRLDALRGAFPYALILLFIAHFFMGRIQEIRITCLLSPFVLLALIDLYRGKTVTKSAVFAGTASGAVIAVGIVALEAMGAMTALRLQINPLIAEFAHQKWWAIVYLQIILGVAVLTSAGFAPDKTAP